MRTFLNFVKAAALAAVVSVMTASTALAAAGDDLRTSKAGARSFWVYASSSNSKAMTLYYVGSSTEAMVTIDVDSIDAEAPFGTSDTGFGTSGSFDLTDAAYDTLGELCDAIDAEPDYGCFLTGGKRDDSSLILRDKAAASATNDLKAAGGFEVPISTGFAAGTETAEAYVLRVGVKPASPNQRVVLKKCAYNLNIVSGTDTVKVFGWSAQHEQKPKADFSPATYDDTDLVTEERISSNSDDTALTVDWTVSSADGAGDGIFFAPGAHVVVSGGNGTSVQGVNNYLKCLFELR